MRLHLTLAVALALPALPLSAQDARLAARLDPATAAAVQAVVDSATAAGLPAEPLVQKALEGRSKGAEPARITGAVRSLSRRLSDARRELGPTARPAELESGAMLLSLGLDASALADLRAARPTGSLSVPLVVLLDLVQRGVPPEGGVPLVGALLRARVDDDRLRSFQRDVQEGIRAGADPMAAARGVAADLERGVTAPAVVPVAPGDAP